MTDSKLFDWSAHQTAVNAVFTTASDDIKGKLTNFDTQFKAHVIGKEEKKAQIAAVDEQIAKLVASYQAIGAAAGDAAAVEAAKLKLKELTAALLTQCVSSGLFTPAIVGEITKTA